MKEGRGNLKAPPEVPSGANLCSKKKVQEKSLVAVASPLHRLHERPGAKARELRAGSCLKNFSSRPLGKYDQARDDDD